MRFLCFRGEFNEKINLPQTSPRHDSGEKDECGAQSSTPTGLALGTGAHAQDVVFGSVIGTSFGYGSPLTLNSGACVFNYGSFGVPSYATMTGQVMTSSDNILIFVVNGTQYAIPLWLFQEP